MFVALSAIQALNYIRDALLLRAGSVTEVVLSYLFYMGTRALPIMLLFTAIVFVYGLAIQRRVRVLVAGSADAHDLQTARRRITGLRFLVLAINVGGFALGHFVNLWLSDQLPQALEPQLLITLGFNLASGAVYAIAQISLHNIVLTPARRLLGIHSMRAVRREQGLRASGLVVAAFTSLYALLFIYTSHNHFLEHELAYTTVLEQVATGTLSLDEADQEYRLLIAAHLARTSSRLQLPADSISFPLGRVSLEDRRTSNLVVFTLLVVVLTGIVITAQSFYSTELRQQVRGLIDKMRDIVQGDGDLTRRVEIVQHNELGDLADIINRFIDQIRGLLLQVKETSSKVVGASDSIRASLADVSSSVEELLAATDQVQENTGNQMRVAESTKGNFDALFSAISSVAGSVDSQASFVEQTSSAMTEMAASIQSVSRLAEQTNEVADELVQVAAGGAQSVEASVGSIREIQDASEKVSEIVGLIASISAQTNLLAMNAAIEAAHAGEHGRGFAVVADEVRNLAEDSGERSKEIVEQIRGMADRIERGVGLSARAGEALARISADIDRTTRLIVDISQAMQEQASGSSEIVRSITSVVDATHSIREQTNAQRSQSDAIRASIEDLVAVTAQIMTSAQEQSLGNRHIVDMVDRVGEDVAKNEEVVDSLRRAIERFTLDGGITDGTAAGPADIDADAGELAELDDEAEGGDQTTG